MPHDDELLIALSQNGRLRARAARTTLIAREVTRRQGAGRLAATALARSLGAVAVFPLDKGKLDLVSLQLTGGGPLGGLLVEHRHPGQLRGYAQRPDAVPHGELAYKRQGAGLGLLPSGTLSVVKQDGHGRYTVGRVPLKNGEIDDDLELYFRDSEQVPTRVLSDVIVDDGGEVESALALLVQVVPPGSEEDLASLREVRVAGDAADLEGLLRAALGEGHVVLERHPLSFRCDCSRERVTSSLKLLDVTDLEEMLEEDKGAEVTCRFCAAHYVVDEVELAALLAERRAGPSAGVG